MTALEVEAFEVAFGTGIVWRWMECQDEKLKEGCTLS